MSIINDRASVIADDIILASRSAAFSEHTSLNIIPDLVFFAIDAMRPMMKIIDVASETWLKYGHDQRAMPFKGFIPLLCRRIFLAYYLQP